MVASLVCMSVITLCIILQGGCAEPQRNNGEEEDTAVRKHFDLDQGA